MPGPDVLDLGDDAQAVLGEQVELGDVFAVVRHVKTTGPAARGVLATLQRRPWSSP